MNRQFLDKAEFLKILKARCSLMHPGTRSMVEPFIDKAIATIGTPENKTKLAELQKMAITDPEKLRQLNKIRKFTIQNFITAMANALTFFEREDLEDDDEPFVVNDSRQEISARYIAEDGKPFRTPAIKERSQSRIDLHTLSTDMVEYPLVDVYKGRVAEQALANIDLSYDLSMKLNAILWDLVLASIGSFSLTGRKADRVYVPHSTIKAGNLPTSNLITLTGNTTSTKFRFEAVKQAVMWGLSFGNNATSMGEIRIETIFVPSVDVPAMLEEINVNSPDNAIVNEILNVGHVVKVAGRQFNLVGDATLDPAQGLAVAKTNVPLGKYLPKPSQSMLFPESPNQISAEQIQSNKGTTFMKEVFGAFVPSQQRMGVLGIRYRTPQ